jgi:hypothetical protein
VSQLSPIHGIDATLTGRIRATTAQILRTAASLASADPLDGLVRGGSYAEFEKPLLPAGGLSLIFGSGLLILPPNTVVSGNAGFGLQCTDGESRVVNTRCTSRSRGTASAASPGAARGSERVLRFVTVSA